MVLSNSPTKNNNISQKETAYLGPKYPDIEIGSFLQSKGYKFHAFTEKDRTDLINEFLYNNNVLGYFDDRMQFWPRALGARSILGNPLNPKFDLLQQNCK